MSEHRVFTLSEVSRHKSKKDCWLVINGRVLDVTKFLEEHPGGEEVLIESAGKDATKEFKDIGHSNAAQNLLYKYQVGVLHGYNLKEIEIKGGSVKESKYQEMSAFVMKEDEMPKTPAFLQFFLPLTVAVSYFSYRYVTMMAAKTG